MAFMEDVLAEIQDPEQKKAFEALPESVRKVLEKRAQSAADAKAAELQAARERLNTFEEADKGWKAFQAAWKQTYGENATLADKIKYDKDRAAEVEMLKAKVAKLEPEAARAAELAKQAEGDVVDPNKVSEIVLGKAKDQFVSREEIKSMLQETVDKAKHAVDFGSIPGTVKLVEHAFRARNEFGLDVSAEDLATASSRYAGRPDAIELAYADLTKEAREKRAADEAKANADKIAADLAAAEVRGAEKARREYEMAHIQGEESGSSVLGTTPLNTPPKDKPGVDPVTYDPSAGRLATEALKHYRELEAAGFSKLM